MKKDGRSRSINQDSEGSKCVSDSSDASSPSTVNLSQPDEMHRFIYCIYKIIIIVVSSAPSHAASTPTGISNDDIEAFRSLLLDMSNDLNSNKTELESNPMGFLQLLNDTTNSTNASFVPGVISRIYDTQTPTPVDPQSADLLTNSNVSDFPTNIPRLNATQASLDIATLSVLNNLFNVISGSINIGSGGIGVIAADLGITSNFISRFFSRSGWLLNVDNFGLTLVKDSGKWAATNDTLISSHSSTWHAALKDIGANANLKSNIQSTIQQVQSAINQFKEFAV